MLLKAFILLLCCSLHVFGTLYIPDCDLHQMTEDFLQEDIGIRNCLNDHYLNLQNRCTESQLSTQRLINSDTSRRLESCSQPTVVALMRTVVNSEDEGARNSFLDAIVATSVMTRLDDYLRHYGLIDASKTLHQTLKEIWFTTYNRNGKLSSGFSHVFAGEVEGSEVKGFYSWISYFIEQAAKRLEYVCYHKDPLQLGGQRNVADIKFRWKKLGTTTPAWKNRGSIFLGTTPELEMALYTLCFYARPDKECPVKLNNKEFRILTCHRSIGNRRVLNTAFPVLSALEKYCG